MGYLGRRIGLSQGRADSDPSADGATGGGLLDLVASGYFQREGNIYNDPGIGPQSAMTATGGVISDYTDSGTVYRAHIFTSTGTFDVSALSVNMVGGNMLSILLSVVVVEVLVVTIVLMMQELVVVVAVLL